MSMATTQNGYGNLDLSPFKVESRREIISLLRTIGEQKQLIRLLMEGSGEADGCGSADLLDGVREAHFTQQRTASVGVAGL